MKLRAMLLVPVLAAGVILSACSSDNKDDATVGSGDSSPTATTDSNPSQAGTDQAVEIKGFEFSPTSFTIHKGQKITWTNEDSAAHTATMSADAPEAFDSGALQKGESKSFVPVTTGTYNYVCSFHANMKASFTVVD